MTKKKICKMCGEKFEPLRPFQLTCSVACAIEKARADRLKQQEKDQQTAVRRRLQAEKEQRAQLKIRRLAVKPRSYWLRQAQQAVNAYVRERDRHLPCVSCGTTVAAQWDAGHYRTVAAAPQLRFDPRQIHKQCSVCNQHKSGNVVAYRAELIRRIGVAVVEEIESDHCRKRWTIEELKGIRERYVLLLKQLRGKACSAEVINA